MNGRFANPYKQLGNSAAGIVNTFLDRDKIQSMGYLDASKQMADIENTRASTKKILDELARQEAINAMGPEQLAPSVTPTDWQQRNLYNAEGRYGETPLPQGMAGPPEPMYERPETLTDADLAAMNSAEQVDAILKRTGGSGTGVNSILEALAPGGSQTGVSGLSTGAQDFIKDNLPIAVRGYAMQHLVKNPGDMMGAISVALAKADEASYNEIMRLLSTVPLANLGILTEDDPNVAIPNLIQRAQQIREGLAGRGQMAPQAGSRPTNALKYNPATGKIE